MKRTAFVVATCVATGLVGVSCGASDPGGKDPDDDGPQVGEAFVVGAEGGVFTLEDGFAIEVPPGAVSAPTDLTVERIEETREGALGPMYVLGPEGQTFDVPVTLTLPITAELELGEGAILDAYGFTAPTGSDDFTRLERHDPAQGAVITETSHFSVFYAGMSPPVVLAQQHAYPTAIAMDADYIYFASGGTEATLPADTNDGYIHRVRRGTSEPEAMTPAEPDPTALWVGDSHVYWASGGDDDPIIPSAIKRVDKATLAIETLVETGDLLSVIGDGSFIYFGDGANGNISRMPLDGGVPEVLAADAGSPEHLAQDAENIVTAARNTHGGRPDRRATRGRCRGIDGSTSSSERSPRGGRAG